jgi:hypothetical protein
MKCLEFHINADLCSVPSLANFPVQYSNYSDSGPPALLALCRHSLTQNLALRALSYTWQLFWIFLSWRNTLASLTAFTSLISCDTPLSIVRHLRSAPGSIVHFACVDWCGCPRITVECGVYLSNLFNSVDILVRILLCCSRCGHRKSGKKPQCNLYHWLA